ncbi:MAG: hypothetical protein KKC20_24635 [Proteobacteria bacterium]|nr:hypothetical protein [Pseudomonadota bacterium]
MKKKIKIERIPIEPVTIVNGEPVYNMAADGISGDGFRYARLMREGKVKEAEAMGEERYYKVKVNGKFL